MKYMEQIQISLAKVNRTDNYGWMEILGMGESSWEGEMIWGEKAKIKDHMRVGLKT